MVNSGRIVIRAFLAASIGPFPMPDRDFSSPLWMTFSLASTVSSSSWLLLSDPNSSGVAFSMYSSLKILNMVSFGSSLPVLSASFWTAVAKSGCMGLGSLIPYSTSRM